jgi:putative addiction module killer protein
VEARRRELRNYVDAEQNEPFQDWLESLSPKIRGVIQARLIRVGNGNLGDCHGVGEGVLELRIHISPGYRIYFGEDGDQVILLSGGTKKGQNKDIEKVKDYWRDYNA